MIAVVARAAMCRSLIATTCHSIPRDAPRSFTTKTKPAPIATTYNVNRVRRTAPRDNLCRGTSAAPRLLNPMRVPGTTNASPSGAPANQRTPRRLVNPKKAANARDNMYSFGCGISAAARLLNPIRRFRRFGITDVSPLGEPANQRTPRSSKAKDSDKPS